MSFDNSHWTWLLKKLFVSSSTIILRNLKYSISSFSYEDDGGAADDDDALFDLMMKEAQVAVISDYLL